MKVLIAFDSTYGNTEKVARVIGVSIAGEVKVVRVNEIDPVGLESVDLLVVGSPTLGGRPSQSVQEFLSKILGDFVRVARVASFDTRYSGKFVKMFGFAADRIAVALKQKGGNLISAPAAFIVTGKKGPLKEGELERAAGWAKEISEIAQGTGFR